MSGADLDLLSIWISIVSMATSVASIVIGIAALQQSQGRTPGRAMAKVHHLLHLLDERGEAVSHALGRLLCRIIGVHGRSCRGRVDHTSWKRDDRGVVRWTGRGWWR